MQLPFQGEWIDHHADVVYRGQPVHLDGAGIGIDLDFTASYGQFAELHLDGNGVVRG